jgi:sulfur carrier protein
MELYLNGELRRFEDGIRISDLTLALGLDGQRFAVEVNRGIVPKGLHGDHALQNGDRVEIIQAFGGG